MPAIAERRDQKSNVRTISGADLGRAEWMFLRLVLLAACLLFASQEGRADIVFVQLKRDINFEVDDFSRQQEKDKWCWAACIEMAYQCQGAKISQRRIVREIKGGEENAPGNPDEVMRALSRVQKDENGELVSSAASRHGRRMDPKFMAKMLNRGIPILAFYRDGGQFGHVVLVTGVVIDANTGNGLSYQVYDPWPLDVGTGQLAKKGRAVKRLWVADDFEGVVDEFVVPSVVTKANVDKHPGWFREDREQRQILEHTPEAEQGRKLLSMIRAKDATIRTYDTVDDFIKSVGMKMEEGIYIPRRR